MIKFRTMMEIITDGQDSFICAVKEANNDIATDIKELLLEGKYWIRSTDTGEISPSIPKELMEADAAMTFDTDANYIIVAPTFDQEVYWKSTPVNPPYFRKKHQHISTDISCERILQLDATKATVIEDFKALAAANNLTPGELIGYVFEKL